MFGEGSRKAGDIKSGGKGKSVIVMEQENTQA